MAAKTSRVMMCMERIRMQQAIVLARLDKRHVFRGSRICLHLCVGAGVERRLAMLDDMQRMEWLEESIVRSSHLL